MKKSSSDFSREERGNPDLSIGGFALWVHGYQFPELEDYWDGNWLEVTARCCREHSWVEAEGPIVRSTELYGLLTGCKNLTDSLSGSATLDAMEPYLNLKIEMRNGGQCQLSVFITHDHRAEEHSFFFELDQSYLPSVMTDLERILHVFPIRGGEQP